MLQRLAELVPVDFRQRMTIVFDAGQVHRPGNRDQESSPAGQDHYGFGVLFASDYDEADTMIEEMIRRSANPQSLLVVSSDQRLIQAAQRRKARPVRSQDCLDELERLVRDFSQASRIESGPAEPVSEKNVSADLKSIDWLAEFQIDPAEGWIEKKEGG